MSRHHRHNEKKEEQVVNPQLNNLSGIDFGQIVNILNQVDINELANMISKLDLNFNGNSNDEGKVQPLREEIHQDYEVLQEKDAHQSVPQPEQPDDRKAELLRSLKYLVNADKFELLEVILQLYMLSRNEKNK